MDNREIRDIVLRHHHYEPDKGACFCGYRPITSRDEHEIHRITVAIELARSDSPPENAHIDDGALLAAVAVALIYDPLMADTVAQELTPLINRIVASVKAVLAQ